MNKVLKYTLRSLGFNFLAAIVLFLPLIFLDSRNATDWLLVLLFIGPLSLIVQLVVGLVYAAHDNKRDLGKGMLLSVGIILLIGLSICGPMWLRLM